MKKIFVWTLLSIGLVATLSVSSVFAQTPPPSTQVQDTTSQDPTASQSPQPLESYKPLTASSCGSTKTQLVSCDAQTGVGTINSIISMVLSVMTILIGVVATGGLAYAGVIYASAGDDQSKVSEARVIIRNVVIGIILYGLTIGIISWLLPGSVIGGDPEPETTTNSTSSGTPSDESTSELPTQTGQ